MTQLESQHKQLESIHWIFYTDWMERCNIQEWIFNYNLCNLFIFLWRDRGMTFQLNRPTATNCCHFNLPSAIFSGSKCTHGNTGTSGTHWNFKDEIWRTNIIPEAITLADRLRIWIGFMIRKQLVKVNIWTVIIPCEQWQVNQWTPFTVQLLHVYELFMLWLKTFRH